MFLYFQPSTHSEAAAAVVQVAPLSLALVADLVHMVQISQECRMQECGVMEASTEISKEGLGSQAVCGRIRIPAGSP
jgi:hypothetical protein